MSSIDHSKALLKLILVLSDSKVDIETLNNTHVNLVRYDALYDIYPNCSKTAKSAFAETFAKLRSEVGLDNAVFNYVMIRLRLLAMMQPKVKLDELLNHIVERINVYLNLDEKVYSELSIQKIDIKLKKEYLTTPTAITIK